MSETRKAEIHALTYAICELMVALDRLFFRNIEGWELNRNGLDFEIEPGRYEKERLVKIYPLNWPQPSAVICRFDQRGELGWTAYKGSVHALHINFNFEFRTGFDGQNIIIESRDSL